MGSLLQNGKQQFITILGMPLVGGKVYFYEPGTETPMATYQDSALTIPNTNPVVLDSRGQAVIWGTGTYRQVVFDVFGVQIWDQIVAASVSDADLEGTGGAGMIGLPDGSTLAEAIFSGVNRVVDSIAALRALSKTFYTRAFVTGYYAPHDGAGGPFQIDPNDTTSVDNGVSIIVANDGARWKMAQPISFSGRQAGAKADGTYDDSSSLFSLFALDRSLRYGDEAYLVTPQLTPTDISRAYSQVSGPGVINVKSGTYYRGTAGQIDSYSLYRITGDASMIFGAGFNGNGQATIGAYSATGPNVYFYPVVLYSGTGQKAIANHVTQNGGHAVEGSSGHEMVIALNTANQHNGLGTTSTNSASLVGNVSENATDSHFFLNTVTGASAVGNVGINGTNGGGMDLAGAVDVVEVASVMTGNAANGSWVLGSPNTNTPYSGILIAASYFRNNCNYPNNEQGEIQIGDYNNLDTYQGQNAAAIGNHIAPQDTPSTAGYNRAVWIHAKTFNTAVLSNALYPDPALITQNQPIIEDKGSTRPIIGGNACFSLTPGYVYFAEAAPGSIYAYNHNMRLHPSSAVPASMESTDGKWNYHIVRPLKKAGTQCLTINYTGGFVHDIIEIFLAQTNDNGAAIFRICLRGAAGFATTTLQNTTVMSVGTNPPQISISLGTGTATISANAAAGAVDNESCAFDFRIVSPGDTPSRFIPIFA